MTRLIRLTSTTSPLLTHLRCPASPHRYAKRWRRVKHCRPVVVAFICFVFLPKAEAVNPPPDGGYPGFNTAEGQNALLQLTTGVANTAVGWLSLESTTEGSYNTAVGAGTLVFNMGDQNTATGVGALLSATNAFGNTANGALALFSNTEGDSNTAVGNSALFSNTIGFGNSAFGAGALYSITNGDGNSAFGIGALNGLTNGNDNIAVGRAASSLTAGSGNIYIGTLVSGQPTEDNHTYVRNINTTTVSGMGTDTVTVNLSTGLLGHLSSSRRYKENIKPMRDASETLYQLKPVTYRYKKEIDPSQSLDYGLVAEEVAKVDPNLANRNRDGQIESVRYNAINAMLLNEFLKEHRKNEEQEATIVRQQKQIDALTAGLQNVSAELELSKRASQLASSHRD